MEAVSLFIRASQRSGKETYIQVGQRFYKGKNRRPFAVKRYTEILRTESIFLLKSSGGKTYSGIIMDKKVFFGTVRPWRVHQCARLESATRQQNGSTVGTEYHGSGPANWE